MRVVISFVLLILTGCNTLNNVSNSDPYFKNKIDKSICSKNNLSVKFYRDGVRYPDIESYDLQIDTSGRSFNVPVGTKMTIVKVYKSKVFADNTYYIVLSKINTPALKDKLVNISELFGLGEDLLLSSENAEYCE